jgi:2',3'-cyclic-nucleotide 2'-phosphodiesterase (5'-nucleotidase family)
MIKIKKFHLTIFLLIGVLLLSIGCFGSKKVTDPQPFKIAISGRITGNYNPCNCGAKPLGGLPRRSQVLKQVLENPKGTLRVDAGSFLSLRQSYGSELTEITVAGLTRMGTQAINVCMRDLRAGLGKLKEMKRNYRVPFISSNIIDAENGKLAFDPYRVISLECEKGTMKVGVIGLTDSQGRFVNPESGYIVNKPEDALKTSLEKLNGKVACIVLLTDAEKRRVIDWINATSEFGKIDMIVSSNLHPNRNRVVRVRDIPLTTTGDKGKVLDILNAEPLSDGKWNFTKSTHYLKHDVPDDEDLRKYLDTLAERLNVPDKVD